MLRSAERIRSYSVLETCSARRRLPLSKRDSNASEVGSGRVAPRRGGTARGSPSAGGGKILFNSFSEAKGLSCRNRK